MFLTKANQLNKGMIDYQYFPNVDDPVAKLRSAMDNMDGMCDSSISLCILKSYVFVSVEALCSYTIPKENKGHKLPATSSKKPADVNLDPQLLGISDTPDNHTAHSGLRLFPPPLFSRQAVPQGYKSVLFLSCETF